MCTIIYYIYCIHTRAQTRTKEIGHEFERHQGTVYRRDWREQKMENNAIAL